MVPGAPSSDASPRARSMASLLALGEDVHDARAATVRLGTAEPQHVDVLTGDRADDVRPGHEDAALRAEDHDVGERRTVRRATRGGAEHDGDLRDLAGRLRHRVEDLADRVQRQHALGEPGATGVPQPDDRRPVGHRALVGVHDDLAADVAHRSAHDGGVGAEGDGVRAVDGADGGEHAAVVVRGDQLERALVEQRREPVVRVARVLVARELRLLCRPRGGCCLGGWGLRHAGCSCLCLRRCGRRWRRCGRRSRRSCSAPRGHPRAGRASRPRCRARCPRGPRG